MRLFDYPASANCLKVRVLLSLLGQEVERVEVDIFAGETLTEEYGELNPLRETPVLQLDDGTALAQSNAILWFLAEGTPYLPATALERAQVAQWLFFEQEWVMSGIGGARFRTITGRSTNATSQRLAQGRKALAVLEAHLEARPYLVGRRCSIADLSNFAYAHTAGDVGIELDDEYPSVAAWIDRVQAEPGFVNDLEPYPANSHAGASRSIYD